MTPHARHLREMRASVAELRAPAAGLPMGIAALSMLATPIDEAQIAAIHDALTPSQRRRLRNKAEEAARG